MQILTSRTVYCQNLPIYTKFHHARLNGCGDIAIFSTVRHFELLKYSNFYFLHALQWQSACSCKISSQSVERLQRYCEFSISNMAAVRHLNCCNMQIFTFCAVYNGKLHVSAKFRLDRLNGVEDIAVFYFQYGGRPLF